jgi:hypothetical protein
VGDRGRVAAQLCRRDLLAWEHAVDDRRGNRWRVGGGTMRHGALFLPSSPADLEPKAPIKQFLLALALTRLAPTVQIDHYLGFEQGWLQFEPAFPKRLGRLKTDNPAATMEPHIHVNWSA